MNKMLVLLLVLATITSITSASAAEINLCEKAVNIGHSWGVCDPSDTTKAQGTFTYNNIGTTLTFTASASGLTSGIGYSLIYYKDTDAAHILPSTLPVNVLATGTASGGSVSFSGVWSGGNIPAVDDINPRGKIWIVPTTEIVGGTLLWTGYGQGYVMPGYLFESDLLSESAYPLYTVRQRMGGILYRTSADGTTSSATVPDVPTTFALSAVYSTLTGFSSNGAFTATLVATDDNGEEEIAGPYSIDWTDEDGAHTAALTEVSDGSPLTKTYTATGAIPYYQDFNSGITISSQGQTTTVTINNQLKGISVSPTIAFGNVQIGVPVTAGASIENIGNDDVSVSETHSNLSRVGGGDSIAAGNMVATTTLPLLVEDYLGLNPGTINFQLTAPVGTLSGDYTGTVTFTAV